MRFHGKGAEDRWGLALFEHFSAVMNNANHKELLPGSGYGNYGQYGKYGYGKGYGMYGTYGQESEEDEQSGKFSISSLFRRKK